MARQLAMKGAVPPTARRIQANTVRQRKVQMNIDCFWSASDSSEYEDTESLQGLR